MAPAYCLERTNERTRGCVADLERDVLHSPARCQQPIARQMRERCRHSPNTSRIGRKRAFERAIADAELHREIVDAWRIGRIRRQGLRRTQRERRLQCRNKQRQLTLVRKLIEEDSQEMFGSGGGAIRFRIAHMIDDRTHEWSHVKDHDAVRLRACDASADRSAQRTTCAFARAATARSSAAYLRESTQRDLLEPSRRRNCLTRKRCRSSPASADARRGRIRPFCGRNMSDLRLEVLLS